MSEVIILKCYFILQKCNQKILQILYRKDAGNYTQSFFCQNQKNFWKKRQNSELKKEILNNREGYFFLKINGQTSFILFRNQTFTYYAKNNIAWSDRYPIRNINSFTSKLANKVCFSKIDFTSDYHAVQIMWHKHQ